ncbi:tetratricopeptide repeat protein [Pontimicrobium sp. IMCC45349]|uniref:tetratricopeptide repeat protein n=1 Tax=Pontimicrobium sp. IMCC45349 TaxID=3391574 RepID=UPI0039A01690
MTKKKLLVLILAIVSNFCIQAQQSVAYTSSLVDFQKALSLYNSKQYLAAQTLFNKIEDNAKEEVLKSDCAYYIANCAVRLNQQNADDLIERFVENYPTSTKRNTAYTDVADYYFENSKFAYARKWYEKVDEEALSRTEREKFNFNFGYSNYITKNHRDAKKYLTKVENSEEYGSQAKYYIGFMAYEGDDYDKASEYFDQVSDNEKYQEKLSYYQADLNFKLGNFEKAIELAKAQLPNSSDEEISELSKIIGESYFNLKQYNEAIPYLNDYQGKNGRWTNTDFYQLGYAYYKQNDFEKAISEFNKIIDGNNSVAQNAYYHLGESYINLGKKSEALNAFRNASQMDFDLKIQEDAWLNYAKISYEIGNPYQSVPQVLAGYLIKYPDTAYKEEIETLLIDSYITSKNYKEALNLLEGKKSFENKVAYQKVAFYRGIELYNESNYLESKSFFEKSLSEPRDEKYTARATFWKAETDYNLTNYDDALVGFKQFQGNTIASSTPEIKNIDYNLAYTYFKQKNYTRATTYFQDYISKNSDDKVRRNDAYLRLGDGHFVSSNYNEAIKAYDKAISIGEIEPDYAFFQKAISYGYLGKSTDKINGLEDFVNSYNTSSLRDDALYELGNSYVKKNQIEKAMEKYNQLNTEYRTSPFVSKALLRQGLVYYNSGENQSALTKFKTVASNYPGTPEALQAVSSARLIYIDLGSVDEYAAWVKTLDYVDVTDVDLDNTTFEAAEKQYLANNTNKAIKQFNGYLNEFPNGIHALKAHFYVAQLYYKDDLKGNAKSHYQYVIEKPAGEFTEVALTRLSEILLLDKNWLEAIPVLERLELEADYPQNIIFAQSNLMKANYQLNNYDNAVSYAEKVLGNSRSDANVKSDAHVIIARSAMKTGDEVKAKAAYAEVEKLASGELAAEALYYNAYFKNKEGKHEASNTTVQKLAKDYSSYKYYAAKGLIVMAKNYYALNDAYQATYILESVIQNFAEFEDVVEEAQLELNKIKTEQAKTNASVETEDGN